MRRAHGTPLKMESDRVTHLAFPIKMGTNKPVFGNGSDLPTIDDYPRFARLDVELDKLCETIWRHVCDLKEHGVYPRHVLVGRDIMDNLFRVQVEQYMSITIPIQYDAPIRPASAAMLFAGLEVHLVPWMHGLVVTPDLTPHVPKGTGTNPWTLTVRDEVRSESPIVIEDTDVEAARAFSVLGMIRNGLEKWMRTPKTLLEVDTADFYMRIGK